ncbi:hypothetical protein P692DRAFT_20835473 [Suillus brevipes Sb2]|nr:hypothetical protein P692DRAFT_20835473 [Suillus brevipes Sb2]
MLGYEVYPRVRSYHPCHPRLRIHSMSHFIRLNRVRLTTLQKDPEAMDEDTAECIPATYRYSFPAHTQPSLKISLQTEPFQIGHDRAVPAGVTARRGHHHKHSLSHNFFSFLDPARQPQPEAKSEELHTAPTPAPMSPWSPVSNAPALVPAQHPLHPLNYLIII